MRDPLARDLRGVLWIQGALALVLALMLVACTVGALLALALAVLLPTAGLWPWLLPTALLAGLDFWAVRRALKAANLLWAFGRWPAGLEGPAVGSGNAVALLAARDSFGHGEWERCLRLLDRLPAPVAPPACLARGRCLALLGRMDEALVQLALGGESAYLLAWLQPRRYFGLWGLGPYLSDNDARRARHTGAPALAFLVLAGGMALVAWPFVQAVHLQAVALVRGFDIAGFESASSGRFVLYDHDPQWAKQVVAIADDALDQDLAFMGLPADTFGKQSIHLFLCADQAEYLRRSPHPVAWEAASALPEKDAIYIYRMPPSQEVYFEIVLAHEISHLVYHRLGITGRKDSWLNEGLADYLGYRYGLDKFGIPRQAWLMEHEFKDLGKQALPFKEFFQVEPHQLPDDQVGTFYRQGASMVYMLIENYGKASFLAFMRYYAATGNVDRSLAAAYPTLPSVEALGAVWGLFFQQSTTSAPGNRN